VELIETEVPSVARNSGAIAGPRARRIALIAALVIYSAVALVWAVLALVLVRAELASAGVVVFVFLFGGLVFLFSSLFAFRQRRHRKEGRRT